MDSSYEIYYNVHQNNIMFSMSFKLKAHKNDLLFVPLGGCNEIGVNVNLYHYKGKWIMVDCGAGFADERMPGVDMMVADLTFIEQNKKDLLALILTHAHEDHLGGVQYLWDKLECPIYATKFTANFLKLRLAEYEFAKQVKIHTVIPGKVIDLKPFSIEMVPLTHSAPEMQGIIIRTEAGNILHTGDWKFDPDPVIGDKTNESILESYGNEGVLALVCDSTNVFNPGTSGSEGEVRKSLVDIIAGCTAMVVTTTFASNLARLDTLIHAGQSAGRKVVLTGRSLHRILSAAQSSGYLQDIAPLVDERSIGKYHRKELLVIATGCQGEQMAATAKMAGNTHPSIRLAPKDTVIFSSKIIPGNEKKIYRLFNAFVKLGVEVVTERDHFVHVSGHPGVEELKRMYALVRPQICIPVHGEPVHIHEHAKLAKNSGIKFTFEPENGDVLFIDPISPKILAKVENGYFGVDGNYLLAADSDIFKMRKSMSYNGLAIVGIVINKKGHLVGKPMLLMPGIFDQEVDKKLINSIKQDIFTVLLDQEQSNQAHISKEQIDTLVRSYLRRLFKNEINKSPKIIINIEQVS